MIADRAQPAPMTPAGRRLAAMRGHIEASRANPLTLVPAARSLYEAGKTRSEVLTAIYGVDLPAEAELIERYFVVGGAPLRVLWDA